MGDSRAVVHVDESSEPASRLLDDAFAISADEGVPEDIKKRAVARLIREAVEVTAKDVYFCRVLAAGGERADAESAWESAHKVSKRIALALSLDPDDNQAVEKWAGGGPARKITLAVVNKGVHQGVFNARGTVNDARRAVADLASVAR